MEILQLAQVKQFIENTDLSAVLKRLVVIDGWKIKHAKAAIEQYKNYLFLKIKYRTNYSPQQLPPSYEIDEVWHAHILHTQQYTDFCHSVMGEYLHHHPHHGQDQEISQEILEEMFAETQELYEKEFGEPIKAIKWVPFGKRISKRKLESLLNPLPA